MVDKVNDNIFLVNAPAGSGKTTRIRSMLDSHLRKCPDDNVLCITYTNRAAEELGRGIDSKNVFFGTIHSFINQFVSSFFSHRAVIDLYWEIYKDKIQKRIDNLEKKEGIEESNNRYIEKYGKLDADTVYNNIQSISYNEAPYNSLYKGALSHDDLISFTRKLVDKFPIIKRKISDKYQLIFIDEYQDTVADVLHIFYETMKNASGKLYLFGDKMQQIYKNYDGSFEKEFSCMNRSFDLRINYRTTPYIVSMLNHIYNDQTFIQSAYEKNSNNDMKYLPEVIITEDVEKTLCGIRQEYPEAIMLYLLNKERFYNIGVGELYDAVQGMERYGYGKKYGVVDVLTRMDNTNPDRLFTLLFLFKQIYSAYNSNLYGKIVHLIKCNKNILNASKYTIKQHTDKKKIKKLLEKILGKFESKDTKIEDFLLMLKQLDLVNPEYMDEIIGEEDYSAILGISINEFHNLSEYLENPLVSTQHGVKGESHDTVIFVAANSNHDPVVHMSKFFELWSTTEVSLPKFEKFYYEYMNLIVDIEKNIGMKCSDMKKEQYVDRKAEIYEKVSAFAQCYSENEYYKCLLKAYMDIFLQKDGVTNAKKCLKGNLVYGTLSAYRLFYVGCSRARKNLSIIINKRDIVGNKEKLLQKFQQCGFKIIES